MLTWDRSNSGKAKTANIFLNLQQQTSHNSCFQICAQRERNLSCREPWVLKTRQMLDPVHCSSPLSPQQWLKSFSGLRQVLSVGSEWDAPTSANTCIYTVQAPLPLHTKNSRSSNARLPSSAPVSCRFSGCGCWTEVGLFLRDCIILTIDNRVFAARKPHRALSSASIGDTRRRRIGNLLEHSGMFGVRKLWWFDHIWKFAVCHYLGWDNGLWTWNVVGMVIATEQKGIVTTKRGD